MALSLAAAAGVAVSPEPAILEGAGFRHSVYRSRLLQMISGAVVVWGALWLGWKLWALVLSSLVQCLWTLWLTRILHRDFFHRCTFGNRARVNEYCCNGIVLRRHFPRNRHGDQAERPDPGVAIRAVVLVVLSFMPTRFHLIALISRQADAGRLEIHDHYRCHSGHVAHLDSYKVAVISIIMLMGIEKRRYAMAPSGYRFQWAVASGRPPSDTIGCIPLLKGLESHHRAWQIAVLGVGCLANH